MKRRRPKNLASNGQNVMCHWCGTQCTNTGDFGPNGATRDHIQPAKIGISDMPRVWCCRACNNVKDSMTLAQWKRFMREFPDYRGLYQNPQLPKFRNEFVKVFEKFQRDLWNEKLPKNPEAMRNEI